MTRGSRRHLFSAQFGDLEEPLSEKLRELIDDFYRIFFQVFGRAPSGLLVDAEGAARLWGLSSVDNLLQHLGVDLRPHELRDLGVARLAWAGETAAKMAHAARLTEEAFASRYTLLLKSIVIKSSRKQS